MSKVSVCSSIEHTGISETWGIISNFNKQMSSSNWKEEHRKRQNIYWLHHTIKEELGNKTYNSLSEEKLEKLEEKLLNGKAIFQIMEKI